MANVFDFQRGRAIRGINPQLAGQELERIRAEKGSLTAEAVLEAATDEQSPLHLAFEWDDSEAAKAHRLNQARRLITSIRVLNSPAGAVKAFLSVRTPEHGRVYTPTVEALSDEELRLRVLADARQAVESLERRFSHLSAVADILTRLRQAVG